MSTSVQLFALAVTLPCAIFFVSFVRRGRLRPKYAMMWLPVVTGMLLFAMIPGLANSVARAFGITYPPAMLFAAAIMLLTMVCMHYSWELSRLEERVRILAETIAVHGASSGEVAQPHDDEGRDDRERSTSGPVGRAAQ